jgi:hypothetical protein
VAAQGKRRREREVEVGAKEMGSVAILGKTKGTGILQTVHTSAPLIFFDRTVEIVSNRYETL